MHWWMDYCKGRDSQINGKVTPGNNAGGITNVLEKALGSAKKGGSSPLNDVVGYLPLGSYPVTQITKEKYNGYDWVVFEYNGGQYWTALIGDRNRLERDDTTDDCSRQLAEANAKIAAAKAALE